MKLIIILLIALICSGCGGLYSLLGANINGHTAPRPQPYPCYYPCEENSDGYRVYRVESESQFNNRMYEENKQWK
jgi:hypothetical protein